MAQIKTDILLNGMRLEIHPSKLTKCGEILINDDCTNAFLFCAFCSDDDPEVEFFRTLAEFIEHIRWHRSDDLQMPNIPEDTSQIIFEDDSRSNFSAPRHTTDDIADWIAPPEELFELNTISNFMEMDSHPEEVIVNNIQNDFISETVDESTTDSMPPNIEVEELEPETTTEEVPEITGEVFIDLLDLFKKCPCAWHNKTAANTNSEVIDGVYKLLAAHYNKCAQQNKSVDYVRKIVTQIKDCFVEEYKDVDNSANVELDCLPWCFPHLSFILDNDSDELDKSVFTDFLCPICTEELTSQEVLWKHIYQTHLELEYQDLNNHNSMSDKEPEVENTDPWDTYPREIIEMFIETYKSQERLWDKNNPEHFSPTLQQESYDLLLNVLREYDPETTCSDVVKKIDHLQTQFNLERQQVLAKNPNQHVQCSWFYDKLMFLTRKNAKKNKIKPPLKARPANFKKKVKNAKCPICTRTFTDHSVWLSHMESAHTAEDYQFQDGFFYCTICGLKNKTKELLMRHFRTKHTHNLQKCTDCNIGFRLLSMLAEHRAKVHDDYSPFKCETCGEGFTNRSRLRTHSITHWSSKELPHKCEYCGAKFNNFTSYSVHIRRHNENKKHRCEICQKDMLSIVDLRQHCKETHPDVYPYLCDSCGKTFSSELLLTTHLNEVHAVVTFSCDDCEQEFKTEKALTDHSKIHLKQFSCDICGAMFSRKLSLRKHERLKHDSMLYSPL